MSSLSRECKNLPLRCSYRPSRRKSSTYTGMAELSEDVEPSTSFALPGPTQEMVQSFDPVKRNKGRKRPLPPSRYPSPNPPSPLPLQTKTATNPPLKLSIPLPKILPWPPPPSPTPSSLGPRVPALHPWPLLSPTPTTNPHQHASPRPPHPALQTPSTRHATRPLSAAPAQLG